MLESVTEEPGTETAPIDPDAGYRALESRDARFDGRFFVGVSTTGIYCRPVCPAPTPKRSHVRFFPCAAAAERAGFRPCLRCRPESAPGSPAWAGTSSAVARALRLIRDGALDGSSVDRLAERVGVGGRHLRRLFDRHLGASPSSIARSRRAHFARRLLDDTDLAMRDVAFAAGFGSLARFNATMRAVFQASPSELRERSRGRTRTASASGASTMLLRVPVRAPYDWNGILAYLGPRAIPGVETVAGGVYRRAVAFEEREGVQRRVTGAIEVRGAVGASALEVHVVTVGTPPLLALAGRLRRLFDVDADPTRIDAHLARDPLLARAIRERPGRRLPGAWDGFELAVRAIVGQQVSVAAATTVTGRIAHRYGRAIERVDPSWPTHLFPTPEVLAGADLESIGMPAARARAIVELARRVHDRRIMLDGSRAAHEVREALLDIPGVGAWTADYVLARSLGEPDAFLPGDLGVRRALGNGRNAVTEREATHRAERWRPWRAYAMLYLWNLLPSQDDRKKTPRRTT